MTDSKLPPPAYFEELAAMQLLMPRAKVLAALADAYGPPGASVALAKPVDIAINHYSEALAMHSPLAQPVLYVSPEQLAEHSDDGPEHGRYLPARKTPAGKFTQPLYAGAPSLQGRYPHLPQSVGDVTDFGDGKVDIDWGHPAPAGGTRLYSAEQMRSYVDADRAARAEQSAGVAGPAISDEDRMTLAGALGLLRGHRYDGSADALQRVLDANAAAPAPSGWRLVPAVPTRGWIAAVADDGYFDVDCAQMIANILSHAPAAPALEAPAAPVGSARQFIEWMYSQPEDREPTTAEGALLEFEAHLAAAAPQAPAAPILGDAERLAAARQDKSLADYWRNRVAGLAEEFTTAAEARYLADRIVSELYDLPTSGVARPAAPAVDAWLQPDDMAALQRFHETAEDDESYDIGKEAVARLCAFGCLQSHSFGRYSTTDFGDYLLDTWAGARTLPFTTAAERAAQGKEGGESA